MTIEPAPEKLKEFHCILCNKEFKNEYRADYHVRSTHRDMSIRERSQLRELILYGKLKYGTDYSIDDY